MAKYLIYKNKKIRSNIWKNRESFLINKYLALNENISFNLKVKTMLKMQTFFTILSINKLTNRCVKTNYPRGIMRLTNLSKSSFKLYLSKQTLTGFTKSSW